MWKIDRKYTLMLFGVVFFSCVLHKFGQDSTGSTSGLMQQGNTDTLGEKVQE